MTDCTITFTYKDGRTERKVLRNCKTDQWLNLIREAIESDSECSANIVIYEFDPAKPNKTWVTLQRFEKVQGNIQCLSY